jgi:hypothetical protein
MPVMQIEVLRCLSQSLLDGITPRLDFVTLFMNHSKFIIHSITNSNASFLALQPSVNLGLLGHTVNSVQLVPWVTWDWVHLVRRPLFGLLYQSRMLDDDECGAVGVPVHLVYHKSHMTWLGLETRPPRWKPATSRLSYGTATSSSYLACVFFHQAVTFDVSRSCNSSSSCSVVYT